MAQSHPQETMGVGWGRETIAMEGREREMITDYKCQCITPETLQGNGGVRSWNKNYTVLGRGVSFVIFNNDHGCLRKMGHPKTQVGGVKEMSTLPFLHTWETYKWKPSKERKE